MYYDDVFGEAMWWGDSYNGVYHYYTDICDLIFLGFVWKDDCCIEMTWMGLTLSWNSYLKMKCYVIGFRLLISFQMLAFGVYEFLIHEPV